MVINTMFLTVFVDPDLGFEIFLEKKKKGEKLNKGALILK